MALKRRDTLPRLRLGASLAAGMEVRLGLRGYTQGSSDRLKVSYLP